MKYNYFDIQEDITLEQLKKQYRKLCFKHHPDKGGNNETFQQVNKEYKHALEYIMQKAFDNHDVNYYRLINRHIYGLDSYIKKLNVPRQFKPAISLLVETGVNELGRVIKQKLSKK